MAGALALCFYKLGVGLVTTWSDRGRLAFDVVDSMPVFCLQAEPTPARAVRVGYRLRRFIALTSLRASLARHT